MLPFCLFVCLFSFFVFYCRLGILQDFYIIYCFVGWKLIHIYYCKEVPTGKALARKRLFVMTKFVTVWNLIKVTIEGFHLF